MTINTPYLALTLYNSTTDQSATFSTFRADLAGVATSSNFYKIDTAVSGLNTRVTNLEAIGRVLVVEANYVSTSYYEATQSLITAYNTNMLIAVNLDADSDGTTTLNINALGTRTLVKIDATGTPANISVGELQAGRYYLFVYDGTQWVWVDATSADQIFHGGTAGNIVLVASDGSISDSGTPASVVDGAISGSAAKTSLGDTDNIGLDESGTLKHITGANMKKAIKQALDGWTPDDDTWSYSSVSSPNGVISVNANKTGVISKGMRLRYEQDEALSGYWTFDSDASASVGSFTPSNVGSPTYTSGKFSNALTLAGSDAIAIADTSTLKPTVAYTIGFWVKSNTKVAEQFVAQSYSANTNFAGFAVSLQPTTGVVRLLQAYNTGSATSDYGLIYGTTDVCDNVFHYVVVTYKDNYAQIYVDGVLEGKGYIKAPAYAATNYIRFGALCTAGTESNFLTGQIDDIFFINGYAIDEKTIYDQYVANTAQGVSDITVQKMGIVTNVGAYSGGATLVTVYHGTDFMLSNSTISNPYFSNAKTPFAFNTNPDKWSHLWQSDISLENTSVAGGTIVNIASTSFTVPAGKWKLSFTGGFSASATTTSVTSAFVTGGISESSSAWSESKYTQVAAFPVPIGTTLYTRYNVKLSLDVDYKSSKTFYLNGVANFGAGITISSLGYRGDLSPTIAKFTNAYL